jgi:hypothetical protein
LNITGGITPHLNIYSKKPQNGSFKIYKRFEETTSQDAPAPGRRVAEPQINTSEVRRLLPKTQELFNDASREVYDAVT